MAKPRKSKRQLVRDERRKKKRDLDVIDHDVEDNYGGVDPSRLANINNGTASAPADEPAAKRRRGNKFNPSSSGANNIPLATRGDGALFFDDVDGRPGSEVAGEVAEAGDSDRKRKRDDDETPYGGQGDYGGDETLGETEFFGLLTDSEHEYFRRADELLELNDFAGGDDERRVFIANVFREARGKELKVASSQSCSRLMERLIQVASVRQKKRLFAAFRGHILTLVSHRFSSHCCEQLFLQSAPWVGRDEEDENTEEEEEAEEGDDELPTLEASFLFVLDELESSLGSLLVHCFASHTLRVLLVILAGRPLDGLATQTLLRSKRKENVRVAQSVGGPQMNGNNGDDTTEAPVAATRVVPESFTFAMQKILGDVSQAIDGPLLNVLPTHPTGNPSLQLLLELDMAEKKDTNKGKKSKKDADTETTEQAPAAPSVSLLERLLPGAPGSLSDTNSQASTLIRTLIYDPIGSRLLETLVVHCPGKLFKALYNSIFAYDAKSKDADTNEPSRPMAVFLRNDIACYPSMRVIERLGKDDLTSVVQNQVLQLQQDGTPAPPPESNGGRSTPPRTVVGQLVDRGRFNVLRTLFERCAARGVDSRTVQHLVNAFQTAIGGGRLAPGQLVKLCLPVEEEQNQQQRHGKRSAAAATAAHVCHLLSAMLAIPGGPASAVQAALLDVSDTELAALANSYPAGARVVMAALQSTPSLRGAAARIPLNKQLVARLVPHCMELATSPVGHVVLVAIVQTPSRTGPAKMPGTAAPTGDGEGAPPAVAVGELSLPFHLKDTLIASLANNEDTLRQTWCGRAVWRAWKGDLWRTRRSEWVHFAKAGEPEGLKLSVAPMLKEERLEREKQERLAREKEQRERVGHVEPKPAKEARPAKPVAETAAKQVTFEKPVKAFEAAEEVEDKMEVDVVDDVDDGDAAARKAKKDAKKAKKEEKKAKKEKKKEKREKEKKEKREKRREEKA
ncbi:Nucleolar protein 9 [Sporothrix stenoceras]|uniref:Nucleolar protein 9 n=1 Tax=Sporothrix stenoceras TaxID=5173 RepID=A0ABR3YSX7_9PEZI